jgi:hypothetical protein
MCCIFHPHGQTRRDLHQSRRFVQQLEAQRLAAQQQAAVTQHDFDKERRQLINLEQQLQVLRKEEAKLHHAYVEYQKSQVGKPSPSGDLPSVVAAPAPAYLSLQKIQQQLAHVAQLTESQRATVCVDCVHVLEGGFMS